MSHQMDSKNGCHGRYSFRGCGRHLFNRMMNSFGSRWFIAIIGEVYRLAWNETSPLHLSAAQQISLYCKQTKNIYIVFQDALSAIDAAKLFTK